MRQSNVDERAPEGVRAPTAWLSAVRPGTLGAALGPVIVGSAFADVDGRLHGPTMLAAAAVALFIQIGTNLHNDYSDFTRGADTDARVGPARATQRGWLSRRALERAVVVSFALAATAGAYLIARVGWPALAIGLFSMVGALAYTGGPRPLGYLGLGDAMVMLFFGVVAVSGTYFVHTGTVSSSVLCCSVALGAFATAILVVNNLRDRTTDAPAGKRTLVVRFGARFGRVEHALLMATGYALVVVVWATDPRATLAWLLPLASMPLAALATHRVATRDGAALNAELATTARVGMLFSALLALAVLV